MTRGFRPTRITAAFGATAGETRGRYSTGLRNAVERNSGLKPAPS
jgi:hypothetical protein